VGGRRRFEQCGLIGKVKKNSDLKFDRRIE